MQSISGRLSFGQKKLQPPPERLEDIAGQDETVQQLIELLSSNPDAPEDTDTLELGRTQPSKQRRVPEAIDVHPNGEYQVVTRDPEEMELSGDAIFEDFRRSREIDVTPPSTAQQALLDQLQKLTEKLGGQVPLFIVSTNRPDSIDPAILQSTDGHIPHKGIELKTKLPILPEKKDS
jgi:hypothetical protein